MQVLIAHKDAAARAALAKAIGGQGGDTEFIEAADGDAALEVLLREHGPRLAVVDWDMPGIEGLELCRLVRDFHLEGPPYIVLLAASRHPDTQTGLEAGANDCLSTPASAAEIRERVNAGRHFVEVPWEQATRGSMLDAIRVPDDDNDENWDPFGMTEAMSDVSGREHASGLHAHRAVELQAVLSER